MEKRFKSKIVGKIAGFVICMVLAFYMVPITACKRTESLGVGADTQTEQPVAPENQPSDSESSQYSAILQTVLTDNYYSKLLDDYKVGSNVYQALPFNFLQKQGHNINAIKNNERRCSTIAYIEENKKDRLYLSVRVETPSSNGNYYSNYVLSYSLTQKEYEDLEMLHDWKYIQAPFFLQELDKQKTATVESATKIGVETYDKLLYTCKTVCKKRNLIAPDGFDLIKVDSADLFTVALRFDVHSFYYDWIRRYILRTLEFKTFLPAGAQLIENVLYIDETGRSLILNEDDFKSNYTRIIYFASPSSYIAGSLS